MLRHRASLLGPLAALAVALLGEPTAAAYCRTGFCPNPANPSEKPPKVEICTEPGVDDAAMASCVAIRWRERCISFSVQQDASVQVKPEVADEVMRKSFEVWMNVDCGGGKHPSISVDDFGFATCNKLEYISDRAGANVLMFRDQTWPHQDDPEAVGADTIALTTVSYATKDTTPVTAKSVKSGDILDADIEVNSSKVDGIVQYNFTTGDTDVETDLLSVLTHEAGHFLGIAHSRTTGATMFPYYEPHSTGLRDLDADDVAAICAAYPPDRESEFVCSGIPRHGYSPECADVQIKQLALSACAMAPASAPSAPFGLGALAALLALAARRRRRS